MPKTDWGWLIAPDELESWVIENSPDVLAINKPAHVICHPTKNGPWSSLSSAVREHFHLDPIHLISRLDRETSGVILIGKSRESAARLRVQGRRVAPANLDELIQKTYVATLHGTMLSPIVVNQPLARPEEGNGIFRNRQVVSPTGQRAETHFEPISHGNGYTFAKVSPKTGRMHQIRVHAAWLGHPIVGDKLYPDENLQLEFLETGWTPALAARLPIDRQALHAAELTILGQTWFAPLPEDLRTFALSINLPPPETSLIPPPSSPPQTSYTRPDPQMHFYPRP